MKYQAIQHLKTKSKLLGLFDSFAEARKAITDRGGVFQKFTYVGGFPLYENEKGQTFTVQGYALPWGVVCSFEVDIGEATVNALRS